MEAGGTDILLNGAKSVKGLLPMFMSFSTHKPPTFKEVYGKEWVYFGERNDYPEHLIYLYNRSAKHQSIINGKVYYVTGGGWGGLPNSTAEQKTILKEFLDSTEYGDGLNDLTRKMDFDLEMFGGFALEVIWSKKGGKISQRSHVPFQHVRSDKENGRFYVSSKWTIPTSEGRWRMNQNVKHEEDFEEYPAYDPENPKGKQLLYYKLYRPGLNVYPLPEYNAACAYIEVDYEIANFWRNAMKNQFAAAFLINVYLSQQPSPERARTMKKEITEDLQGTDNAWKWILNIAKDRDHGSEVVPIPQGELDKQFDLMNKTIQQEIFTAHRIPSPMLFGIKTEGQLGGRTEIIESNELFQNNFVTPRQQMLEKVVNELAVNSGYNEKLKLKRIEPIGVEYSEQLLLQVLPKPALRDIVAQRLGLDLKKYESTPAAVPTVSETTQIEAKIEPFTRYGQPKSGFAKIYGQKFDGILTDEQFEDWYRQSFAKKEDKKKDDVPELSEIIKSPDFPKVPRKKPDIFVMYSYEWIEGFSDADIDTSREFCRQLLELDRYYTRKEIDAIGAEVGWNVWEMRGGWYTLPGTDTHVPHCRHQWVQNIVSK